MEKLLSESGLKELWSKIKDRSLRVIAINQNDYDALEDKNGVLYIVLKSTGVSLKYNGMNVLGDGGTSNAEFGDTMVEKDGVIDVANPNKGIMTQEKFDSLSDEEKNNGTYIIPGDGGSFNPYFPEIYSEQETIVGRWIDGRPVYRRVFEVVNPATFGGYTIIPINDVGSLINTYGEAIDKNGNHLAVSVARNFIELDIIDGKVRLYMYAESMLNTVSNIVLEYTKNTD